MSWLSKGLKKIQPKNVLKAVGKGFEKIDDFALPAIGFALGGPAGAALGSAAARGIGDGKFNAGATLGAAAKGYAGGQLASGLGLVGGRGVSGLLGSGQGLATGGSSVAGQSAAGGALKSVASGGGGGGFGGFLGSAGNFLKDNPELILGGISAIQGAREQQRANETNKRALALAEQPWKETEGLRKLAIQRLMNPETPDLSNIYSGSSNPFARPLRSVR